ncbi:MAG: Smr/MutS family protein, partial [Alphaproteobacteria bacterium]|nr:Smr/MutS family protein [Alphaproteobacteria bacterium]
ALLRFLARCQGEGMRLVRVITGKGRGGEGKLRRAVLEWLNLPELRGLVISCAHAPARQGGEGALDLILRRRR